MWLITNILNTRKGWLAYKSIIPPINNGVAEVITVYFNVITETDVIPFKRMPATSTADNE